MNDPAKHSVRAADGEQDQAVGLAAEVLALLQRAIESARQELLILPDDMASRRTLGEVAEYAEEHFGHSPSQRAIQIWRDDGSLRMRRRGRLWDFSHSDLEALVRRPGDG
jgi:hypothetical protein